MGEPCTRFGRDYLFGGRCGHKPALIAAIVIETRNKFEAAYYGAAQLDRRRELLAHWGELLLPCGG